MCGKTGEVMWVARKLNLVLKHLDEMRKKSTRETSLHSPMNSHPVFGKPATQVGLDFSLYVPHCFIPERTKSTGGKKQEGHLESPVPLPDTSTLKMSDIGIAR